MYSTTRSVCWLGSWGGEEQQVDVAERRQHAAAVAAGRARARRPLRASVHPRRRVLVQRGDKAVDQAGQQARGLQAGDLLLLERVLHMLLNAREMAPERAQRRVARRLRRLARQGGERVRERRGRCLGLGHRQEGGISIRRC